MSTSVPMLVGKCIAGLAIAYAAAFVAGLVWWGRGDLDTSNEDDA